MKLLNWLNQRRKAIVPVVIGILGLVTLYLQLNGDGNFTNADLQTFIGAIVALIVTTLGVHQAQNQSLSQPS